MSRPENPHGCQCKTEFSFLEHLSDEALRQLPLMVVDIQHHAFNTGQQSLLSAGYVLLDKEKLRKEIIGILVSISVTPRHKGKGIPLDVADRILALLEASG